MKISFGIGLDGYETLEARQALAMPICGPLALLQLLETRLGLKAKSTTSAHRVVQFRQILERLAVERPTFYVESFKKDPYAVAETLLQWRDDLIEAGWDGQASVGDTARLRDMATVEAQTTNCLSAGSADRLRSVNQELASRSPKIDLLTVSDPKSHLSKLWQLICEKLGARFEPVSFPLDKTPKAETSDLARIQSLLLNNNPTQRLSLKGDLSILCLTAFSEVTLANGAAQVLRDAQRKSDTITLVAADNAEPVEQALLLLNEPAMGLQPSSTARPIPQVLLLALRLYWKPVDPRALLEFLAHPACPVTSLLRYRLANAVAESPGIGGPEWQKAVTAAKESVKNSGTLKGAERQQAVERIEQDLKDWVGVAEFDVKAGARGSSLSECCARIARWAAVQSDAYGVSIAEANQFRALASLSSEMADLLQSQFTVNRSQLERLLYQVSGAGWSNGSTVEELGHIHRVAKPSAINESVHTVIWWDFSEPPAPASPPWTTQELKQLRGHGAEFPTPEIVAATESAGWLRPILAAKKQIILILPRERAGEPVARHPLHTRILSLLDEQSAPLPIVDLDRILLAGKAKEPFQFVEFGHRAVPSFRRWWKLKTSLHLGPRSIESYSSAEKFIYSPYAWVLNYKAGLKAGPIASLRLKDDHRQKGTLLHRMLDFLLAAAAQDIDWRTCSQTALNSWLEALWPTLLEQEAANLLLPGKRADALGLLELGKLAMWELLRQLQQAKVVEARSNESLPPAPFIGGEIGGIIDLVVRSHQGSVAVLDLKFGGRKIRESELQENRQLQLAVYGYILSRQSNKQWPAEAFYLLRDRRLVALSKTFFPDARVILSKFQPGGIEQCWTDFEQVWRWRRRQLDEGCVEVTVGDTEPTDGTDGMPNSTPPVGHWAANEDHAKFNDFDALTGWRADS